jgi:hypothetical protein
MTNPTAAIANSLPLARDNSIGVASKRFRATSDSLQLPYSVVPVPFITKRMSNFVPNGILNHGIGVVLDIGFAQANGFCSVIACAANAPAVVKLKLPVMKTVMRHQLAG